MAYNNYNPEKPELYTIIEVANGSTNNGQREFLDKITAFKAANNVLHVGYSTRWTSPTTVYSALICYQLKDPTGQENPSGYR